MQIRSHEEPDKVIINADSREIRQTVLDGLPLTEGLPAQFKLAVRRMLGLPQEMTVSHDGLTTLASDISYYGTEYRHQEAAVEVLGAASTYLASQPQAGLGADPRHV